MKKYILTSLMFFSLFLLANCEKYNELFDAQYHKVLNIKQSGEQSVILYTTGEKGEYVFSVMKTGSEINQVADAEIVPMEESFFTAYAKKYNITSKYLPSRYYKLQGDKIHFDKDRGYEFVKVLFETNEMNKLNDGHTEFSYVLPLVLRSDNATVNDSIIIIKPQIIVPYVQMENSGYQNRVNFTTSGESETNVEIALNIPIKNLWNFNCNVAVSENAKNAFKSFNTKNDDKYTLLPENNYSFKKTVAFSKGKSSSSFVVNINKNDLSRNLYVIPIEIESCDKEGFSINEDKRFIFVGVDYNPDKIDLSTVGLSSNSIHVGDGTGLKGLYDGLGSGLHFHSKWSGNVVDATYGNYIQFELKTPIKSVMFKYHTRFENGNGAPKKIKLFTSVDGKNWVEMAEINSNLPKGGNQQYVSKIYNSQSPFKYFRFCALESMAGSMTSGHGSYFNLGEFELYGN